MSPDFRCITKISRFATGYINNSRFFIIRDLAVTASSGRIRQGIINTAFLVF